MEIDDLTKRRITKYLDKVWEGQKIDGRNGFIATGMYAGALQILKIINVHIDRHGCKEN